MAGTAGAELELAKAEASRQLGEWLDEPGRDGRPRKKAKKGAKSTEEALKKLAGLPMDAEQTKLNSA